jgi:hypothetical protein
MPEMQNFNYVRFFLNAIVDQNRCMDEPADTGAAWNLAAKIRVSTQQIHMIEEIVAEAFGAARKINPGILEDVFQIG